MQFQISSRLEKKIKITQSSRLEFLEKYLANSFALSDPQDDTSRPMNRTDIAGLPLLRTLLAIHQKPIEPSFCEVIKPSVLLAYTSLAT